MSRYVTVCHGKSRYVTVEDAVALSEMRCAERPARDSYAALTRRSRDGHASVMRRARVGHATVARRLHDGRAPPNTAYRRERGPSAAAAPNPDLVPLAAEQIREGLPPSPKAEDTDAEVGHWSDAWA